MITAERTSTSTKEMHVAHAVMQEDNMTRPEEF